MAGESMMLREILEQPDVVQRQIDHLFDRMRSPDERMMRLLDRGKREIYLVGCGTSHNAGLIAKHIIGRYCDIDIHTSISSEFYLTDKQIERGGVVIAMSQSGGTADTIKAIDYAKEHGFDAISIVNAEGSKMEEMSEFTIPLNAGPELAIASTKCYAAEISTIACMAYLLMKTKDKGFDIDAVRERCKDIGASLQSIIDGKDEMKRMAKLHAKSDGVLFIGKGMDYVTCREARLKMSEVNYVMASAIPAEELRHGPIAMIDGTRSVIGVVSDRGHLEAVEYNLKLAKDQGARTMLVTAYTDAKTEGCCDDLVVVPEIDPFFAPIASIIPLQLLVYYIGKELGHDIDSPRNLVKCVGERK